MSDGIDWKLIRSLAGGSHAAIPNTIQQRIAVCWFAAFTAKGFIAVQQLPFFPCPWISSFQPFYINIFDIVFGRSRQSQLIAEKIFEYGTAVSIDGTMTLIGNDK